MVPILEIFQSGFGQNAYSSNPSRSTLFRHPATVESVKKYYNIIEVKNAKNALMLLPSNKYSIFPQTEHCVFAHMNLLSQNKKRQEFVQGAFIHGGADQAAHV